MNAPYQQGPQFSVGCGISSRAAEFALNRGMQMFPQIFTKIQKWLMISTIVGLMKLIIMHFLFTFYENTLYCLN